MLNYNRMHDNEEEINQFEFQLSNYYSELKLTVDSFYGTKLCDILYDANTDFDFEGCKTDYNKIMSKGLKPFISIAMINLYNLYNKYYYDNDNSFDRIVEAYINEPKMNNLGNFHFIISGFKECVYGSNYEANN